MNQTKPQPKKKRRLKPVVIDSIFCIGGLAVGEVVALLVKDIPALKWLSFEILYGIQEPIQFNLLLFKFVLGCTLRLSPALLLFGFLGILLSRMMQASSADARSRKRAYDLHPDKNGVAVEDDEEEEEFEEDEEVEVDDSQRFDY